MVIASLRLYVLLALLALPTSMLWRATASEVVTPAQLAMETYRHVIGRMDGRSCPSWPVCSLYATQAVDKHGLLLGSWAAMDRLIHEGDDLRQGQWLMIDAEQRLYDPLSRNDFWLEQSLNEKTKE